MAALRMRDQGFAGYEIAEPDTVTRIRCTSVERIPRRPVDWGAIRGRSPHTPKRSEATHDFRQQPDTLQERTGNCIIIGTLPSMFLFFSSRAGLAGSILISTI